MGERKVVDYSKPGEKPTITFYFDGRRVSWSSGGDKPREALCRKCPIMKGGYNYRNCVFRAALAGE